MTTPPRSDAASNGPGIVAVSMGQWAVASTPTRIRTLLGSCVAVVLHDRVARLGGVAHIVLPASNGTGGTPGKYADTAIPAMIEAIEGLLRSKARGRLVAKLLGGASMFPSAAAASSAFNIGPRNQQAAEAILGELRIPIMGRDLGGSSGRHLTFDTASGIVAIRIPGGADYEL